MKKYDNIKVYLATPYSHEDKMLHSIRFEQVSAKAAQLMEAGYKVFSPISHSHPISTYCKPENNTHDFWLRQDFWILELCDEMHILCLDGWRTSKGVDAEIVKANELGIPIVHHYYIRGRRI